MVKKGRPNAKRNKKTKEKENENDKEQRSVDAASIAAAAAASTSSSSIGNSSRSLASERRTVGQGPMYTILSNAQLNETFHKRYIKELKQLYSKLDHDAFMFTFIKMFKTVLEADEGNEYGNTALAFCAKFVTSFESEKTHPILAETFCWLLSTISNSPHIRYRICFFVNLILKHLGPYAALDDSQCDQILHYMLDRLKDMSPSVRKEAVLAMQRLQVPDHPNDPVLCAYQYHLSSDPSSSVRQCIISCMGRNYLTVPHILQRLWDVDEKVRRHTYINMCNYPVRSYKVSQRLTLLERGLNDSSENVRKNVIKYMLKAWIESYQQNYIQLTAALKLDSNEEELMRFRRVARQMLFVIFEQTANSELLAQLPLTEDCDLHRCVPHEALTVELVLYWQCLSGYLQQTQADEFEQVLPELSVFCDYVKKFCQFQKPDMDKFAQIEFQSMMLSLVEILQTYDLGDEIGRANLKELITHLLRECLLDHKIVAVLVRCAEQLVSDVATRMQYFIEIIYEICELNAKQNDFVHDRELTDKLLDNVETSLVMKIRSLKVKILELEEMEENFVRQKEYMRAQAVNDERMTVTDEYRDLIQPLLEKHGELELPTRPKLSKQERVLKGLYISFYMVASEHVHTLNPSICKLYKDFICRHLASTELDIFEWAIKCGTTFSILYEAYTKEVFDVLVDEFYKNNNLRLCEISAQCVCELMDHYGVDYFMDLNQSVAGQGLAPKSKRRLLFTMQDFDGEEDRSQSQGNDQNTDIISMMGFFVEKVVDKGILLAIVRGLCRLVLRGHLDNRTDVLEKLLKRYFNPNTEPIISQVLGMFFENIVAQKLQHLLEPCLLPIVWSVMNCSYDSLLNDVLPEHVTKFFIDLTVQEMSKPQNNLHNRIAISFLHYIHNYYTERKEMCRLLAKELTTLKLNVLNSSQMKDEMLELADKLVSSELEPRMIKNIVDFKDVLNGSFNPPARKPDGNESEADAEECESVTATIASTSECPTQVPAAPESEPPAAATAITEAATLTEAAITEGSSTRTSPSTVAVATEPVLTTFGANNQVGIRFLRRSLHNSISHSDAESNCSSQTPAPDAEALEKQQQQQEEIKEISRRNLCRDKTKQRLEKAIARASKTPEKQPEAPEAAEETYVEVDVGVEEDAENEAEKEAEATVAADVPEIAVSPAEEQHSDSDVIVDSPTAASPVASTAQNESRLRLRSMRNRNATGTRNTPAGGSKRKVLHLEIQTPLRNGRKRVLRKSLAATPATSSQSSDSATSSKRVSPLRKQLRLDARTTRRRSSVAASPVPKTMAAPAAKSTASPTDSSSSSIKENTVPAPVRPPAPTPKSNHKTPQRHSTRRSGSQMSSSTPVTRIITRHSARSLRMSAMSLTRKRMSQELSMTEGHLKMSTPKRVRQDKAMRNKSTSGERAAVNTSSSRSATTRTRAGTAETAAVATRTRRK
ncbi:condensin complex subunit 3 [Drosophila novamexicana]|uniref:condensin complex subunit 3 n=1 Tax=Drosophila novamexicana TaxID=47314 RepID=UPI0011E5979D|nr:condensin complex subunit 3 [Drosophila novamexicana]